MAEGIELTAQQTQALAATATQHGSIVIHQLSSDDGNAPSDIYVTVVGTSHGHRITPNGVVTDIGETLPANETSR